jgi:hypothetical protein
MRKNQSAMQSLLQDILRPATSVLLNTIDSTMNSNTMLFKVRADQLLTTINYQAVLNQFLRSSLFREMFLEVDQLRRLLSYIIFVNGQPVSPPLPESFVQESFPLTLTSMNEYTFAERIDWMLTTAFSPYRTHISESRAQEVIRDFFWEVFAPESWPLEQSSTRRYWGEHAWLFYDVAPNFLHSTGYFNAPEEYEPSDFAYFDGGEADTCTFFYRDDIFYLLLTNGSP